MIGATSINSVILMGRLTASPEFRQTANGVGYTQFTVAVTQAYKNQNGEYGTDFISCIAWRATAEFICRNFAKGRLILLEGSLHTRSYEDKNYPDVKHYVTEVFVDNVGFGETKSKSGEQNGSYPELPSERKSNSAGAEQPKKQAQPAAPQNVVDLRDFEEIISDNQDLPF